MGGWNEEIILVQKPLETHALLIIHRFHKLWEFVQGFHFGNERASAGPLSWSAIFGVEQTYV